MSKIKIDCDCGHTIETTIDSDYDVDEKSEGIDSDLIECPDCHTKYDVQLVVSIL